MDASCGYVAVLACDCFWYKKMLKTGGKGRKQQLISYAIHLFQVHLMALGAFFLVWGQDLIDIEMI